MKNIKGKLILGPAYCGNKRLNGEKGYMRRGSNALTTGVYSFFGNNSATPAPTQSNSAAKI